MKIAIIDADLIGRKRHRFPNLACMKLSGYHKEQGDEVELKLDYNNLDSVDRVYISKVFMDPEAPNMFDMNAVQVLANDLGYYDLVIFLVEHRSEYAHFILTGEAL